MTVLSLQNLWKRYPRSEHPAVRGLNLEVQRGETFALLGESGSGKTTTLRLIAGFEVPSEGSIQILSRTVAGTGSFVPPEKRHVGMVFQQSSLFPHLTVRRNLEFAVQKRGDPQRRRVAEILGTVELEGYEGRYPHELSGGQRQRVELARALISGPALLLLDEPFSSLDVSLRGQLRAQISRILHQTQTTSILVTHDVADALTVSDRVAVLRAGRLEQSGAPREVYMHPANAYVARFFGTVNLLEAKPHAEGVLTAFGPLAFEQSPHQGRSDLLVCVRPESLELADSGPVLEGIVEQVSFLGRCQEVSLRSRQDSPDRKKRPLLVVLLPADLPVAMGQSLALRPKAGSLQLVRKDEDWPEQEDG